MWRGALVSKDIKAPQPQLHDMPDKEITLLQVCRRQSKLTQGDIKCIANMPNTISISRYEKGVRRPSLNMTMLYHILFDVSLEYLLPDLYERWRVTILENCIALKDQLLTECTGLHIKERLAFLDQTIMRLEEQADITKQYNETV